MRSSARISPARTATIRAPSNRPVSRGRRRTPARERRRSDDLVSNLPYHSTLGTTDPQPVQHFAQYFIGIEIGFRQMPRSPRVVRIIARDPLGAGHRLIERPEGEQAVPTGIVTAEPGVLHEGG